MPAGDIIAREAGYQDLEMSNPNGPAILLCTEAVSRDAAGGASDLWFRPRLLQPRDEHADDLIDGYGCHSDPFDRFGSRQANGRRQRTVRPASTGFSAGTAMSQSVWW
jgi:hypothetical protein